MMHKRIVMGLSMGLAVATLSGCHYVKQDAFEAQLAELRGNDASMRSDIDALQSRVDSMESELQQKLAQYDAKIEKLQGRVSVDMSAHFGFDDATLRAEDKPVLDDFAAVIREHDPDAIITVEGFTDPAGSAAYNKRLGQKRADAVRSYLVGSAGLSDAKVRTVSYGEDSNRQVAKGAWGDDGMANRRVALVIDYSTPSS